MDNSIEIDIPRSLDPLLANDGGCSSTQMILTARKSFSFGVQLPISELLHRESQRRACHLRPMLSRFDRPGFQEREPSHRMLESIMLSWALTFLVLALIAALFGFGGIAAGAASIAKILFFLFLVLFVVSLIGNTIRGRNVI